jgi:ABC-type lipoprotein export system ATPase subunit
MLELAQKSNSSVIVSTHDERLLSKAARVLQLRDGRIVAEPHPLRQQEATPCIP